MMLSTIYLAAATILVAISVEGLARAELSSDRHLTARNDAFFFTDECNNFTEGLNWICEYSCPGVHDGKLTYTLQPGIQPDHYGSWSKTRYTGQRYTSGRFEVSLALSDRPAKGKQLWWGIALWDDTKGMDKYNEINIGYLTSGSLSNSQLLFESARDGISTSVTVDAGVDLYDGRFHTYTIDYSSERVACSVNNLAWAEITDKRYIPVDPMDFIVGARLVPGMNSELLDQPFVETVAYVKISPRYIMSISSANSTAHSKLPHKSASSIVPSISAQNSTKTGQALDGAGISWTRRGNGGHGS